MACFYTERSGAKNDCFLFEAEYGIGVDRLNSPLHKEATLVYGTDAIVRHGLERGQMVSSEYREKWYPAEAWKPQLVTCSLRLSTSWDHHPH